MANFVLSIEHYFQKIGYTGSDKPTFDTLKNIQHCHLRSIPFENVDAFLNIVPSLDPLAIQTKLITNNRGGLCFEHNYYLYLVLEKLGFKVTTSLARVCWQKPVDVITANNHLIVNVEVDDKIWIIDVGFSTLGHNEPVELVKDVLQANGTKRFVDTKWGLCFQMKIKDLWEGLFVISNWKTYPVDWEVGNWYVHTNPTSFFKQNLLATLLTGDKGHVILFNTALVITNDNGEETTTTITEPNEWFAILSKYFHIDLPIETKIAFGNGIVFERTI